MTASNFVDDNHALVTGMVLGALVLGKFRALPAIDSHGDYLPAIDLELTHGGQPFTVRLLVLPGAVQ